MDNYPEVVLELETAFALTTQYGIMARSYFIYLGQSRRNEAFIQETPDMIDAIKPLSAIVYILDLFPDTVLYEI